MVGHTYTYICFPHLWHVMLMHYQYQHALMRISKTTWDEIPWHDMTWYDINVYIPLDPLHTIAKYDYTKDTFFYYVKTIEYDGSFESAQQRVQVTYVMSLECHIISISYHIYLISYYVIWWYDMMTHVTIDMIWYECFVDIIRLSVVNKHRLKRLSPLSNSIGVQVINLVLHQLG